MKLKTNTTHNKSAMGVAQAVLAAFLAWTCVGCQTSQNQGSLNLTSSTASLAIQPTFQVSDTSGLDAFANNSSSKKQPAPTQEEDETTPSTVSPQRPSTPTKTSNRNSAATSDYSVVFPDAAEIEDSEQMVAMDNTPELPGDANVDDFTSDTRGYASSSRNELLCPNSVYYASWRKQFDENWNSQNKQKYKSSSQRDKALSQARTNAFIHLVYPAIEKTGYDYPVEITPSVLAWIDYFTGKGRKNFVVWMRRGLSYIPEMEAELDRNGLPKDLVYLSMIESGFSTKALSYAAAVGLWQFTSPAAKDYNLKINDYVDERRDPTKSTQAAARYLSNLYATFGSWHLASAAYNCGPGCVQKTLRHYGQDSSYFQLTSMGVINSQTANYVPKIIAAMIVAKNPQMFGFDTSDMQKPIATKKVPLDRSLELSALAREMRIDLAVLENLNPELRLGVTPPSRYTSTGTFFLKVPASKYDTALLASQNLPTASPTRMVAARIKRRETVSAFASHYQVSLASFLKANSNLNARTHLARGQLVYIPVSLGSGQYTALTSKTKGSKTKTVGSSKKGTQKKAVAQVTTASKSNKVSSHRRSSSASMAAKRTAENTTTKGSTKRHSQRG